MATLAAQTISRTGLEPDYDAATEEGDDFANTGVEFIHVKNASVASITVTVVTTITVDGLAVADLAVAIPASEERMIGPFPCRWYGSSVDITYSDVTTLTIALLKPGS